MKKLFTFLVFAACIQISFAQQNVFKIDYTVAIDESLREEIISKDVDDGNSSSLFFDIIDEMKNQSVMTAWIGKEQYKIQSNFLEQWVQITDNQAKTVVRIDSASSSYSKLNYGEPGLFSAPVNLNSNETAVIAGIPCKLAIMEIEGEELENETAKIEIWYAEAIPQIIWGDYEYLKDVPGAALKISVGGVAFIAKEVTKTNVPANYFETPTNYTEVESLEGMSAEAFENIDLGEGLVAYFDSTSYSYGLQTTEGNKITEPIFGSVGPFSNGLAIATDESNMSGIIDTKGNNKTEFIYEYLYFDPEVNAFQYSIDGKMSLMDQNGKAIWKNSYSYFSPFNQNYSVASLNNQSGIIDRQGEIVVPFRDQSIIVNDNYYYVTEEDGDFKAYDIKTNALVLSGYPYLYVTNNENLFKVSEDGLNFGLVNAKGDIILPLKYGYITDFQDGVATAMENSEDEVEEISINSKGQIIK